MNTGSVDTPAVAPQAPKKEILVSIEEIYCDPEDTLFDVNHNQIPAAGVPHWKAGASHPAIYVREGSNGTKDSLRVKIKWVDNEQFTGQATLKGVSDPSLRIELEGTVDISGETGEKVVTCTFKKRPLEVRNLSSGVIMTWSITCQTTHLTGGDQLKLFFVDAKPKPITWNDPYVNHYLKVVEWATTWAENKKTETPVFDALWSKFSDGTKARNPHVTGLVYWKTDNPAQNLNQVINPTFNAADKGWSCRGIAHTFMACLAVHGIRCREVEPNGNGGGFLVHNWELRPGGPVPNWYSRPSNYYGGSWLGNWPKETQAPVISIYKELEPIRAQGPPTAAGAYPTVPNPRQELMEIDFKKKPGAIGQGQDSPPLTFGNHWIVAYQNKFYDTSYGMKHNTTVINDYGKAALAGWLIDRLPHETTVTQRVWLVFKKKKQAKCKAFVCREYSYHSIIAEPRSQARN